VRKKNKKVLPATLRVWWGNPRGNEAIHPRLDSDHIPHDVKQFNEWFQSAGRGFRTARGVIETTKARIPLSEWQALHERVFATLVSAHPRKISLVELQARSRPVTNALVELKAKYQAIVKSGLVGLLRGSRRANKRARDAEVRRTEDWALKRILTRGAVRQLTQEHLAIVEEAAQGSGGGGLKALKYLGIAPGIRRLSEIGVPSSTIPALLRLVGIAGFTTTDIRNTLARTK